MQDPDTGTQIFLVLYLLIGTGMLCTVPVLNRVIFLGCAGFDEQQERSGGEPAGPPPGVHQRADPPGR
jgi:hypothetical protein